jgi:GntR family transcriptional regulator
MRGLMADERPGIAQRLALYLDRGGPDPLHRQIVDRLWLEVVTGSLDPGERLPTIRQLAVDLGIHPNTISRAVRELELLGVLTVRPEGVFVSLSTPDSSSLERQAQLERLCRDLLAQAAAFGFSAHELIDMLQDLRADESGAAGGENHEQ